MKKDILLIAFAYPPFDSIGSRRWAKFSKYLALRNYRVHVISAKNPSDTDCTWMTDIQNENIEPHYISSGYADLLLNFSNSFIKKVIKRFLMIFLKLFSKGNVYDLGLFWKKRMLRKASALIKEHNIKNIIVSGPPFRVNYYATKLKDTFPDVNLISDLRDPWLDGNLYKTTFSKATEEYEAKLEKEVVIKSDFILHTDKTIHDEYVKNYRDIIDTDKLRIFTHAYDDIKISQLSNNNTRIQTNGNHITIIFGGNITIKSFSEILDPLFASLKKLKELKPGLYNRLKLIFYTNVTGIHPLIKKYNLEVVQVHPMLLETDFYKKVISDADYLLMFLPSNLKDFLTTKYADYLSLKKPYLNISQKGRVSDFVEENNIGFNIFPEREMFDQLLVFLENAGKPTQGSAPEFNIGKFSYSSLTDKLEKLFVA